jgi:hypothetical protein
MSLLAEFPQSVVDSHAWIVAESLAGGQLSHEIILQLGAEALSVEKIAVMTARAVDTIQAAHGCWQDALACFQTSEDLWSQLPPEDKFVEVHRRLLCRLTCRATDMLDFYYVSSADRNAYKRRKLDPPPVAEGSNGAAL